MAARLLIHTKDVDEDAGTVIEIVVWDLDDPVPPCRHSFKYRLYFGGPEGTRIRYDNERRKGDHRHEGETETAYPFVSIEQLLADFQRSIQTWR